MFVLQVVLSFVAGGIFISALSLIAERVSDKIAGIIVMLPSTIILGFFFVAWTSSSKALVSAIPSTFTPLGVSILIAPVYIYIAIFISKYVKSKLGQIAISMIISSIFWLIFAVPFAVFRFSNIYIGLLGYAILAAVSYALLNIRKDNIILPKIHYGRIQIITRAVFVGIMISFVVVAGKLLNPFWGGVFTMFPAATFSYLVIFHYYYEPKNLFHFMKKAPLGSLTLIAYDFSAMFFFPVVGFIAGTLISMVISFFVSFGLARLQA